MTDEPNFAGHPPSINELRAHKEHDAAKWTPRDALIAALRDIDEGKCAPHSVVVAFVENNPTSADDEQQRYYRYMATRNLREAIGLIEVTKADMLRG